MVDGLVLSRSCTTGWFDWGHGELIITADALIRRRLRESRSDRRPLFSAADADPAHDWLRERLPGLIGGPVRNE